MCSLMAHPAYLREKARALRVDRRLSIDEIADRLALPKTTIFYWVRDLPLNRPRRANPGQRRGNLAMVRKWRRLRDAAYDEGWNSFAQLAEDPTFRDFVCMYIGEGYKRDRNAVSICNSDPRVVVLSAGWIRRLTTRRVSYQLWYHPDQNVGTLCAFWAMRLRSNPRRSGPCGSRTAAACPAAHGAASTAC
jgi:hypothetical protein